MKTTALNIVIEVPQVLSISVVERKLPITATLYAPFGVSSHMSSEPDSFHPGTFSQIKKVAFSIFIAKAN